MCPADSIKENYLRTTVRHYFNRIFNKDSIEAPKKGSMKKKKVELYRFEFNDRSLYNENAYFLFIK